MVVIEYPSQAAGMAGAPEPMLLDTCVIQNIEWVWDRMEDGTSQWTEDSLAELEARFGKPLADELIALGYLVDHFQYNGGFPWLVSASAKVELERHLGGKGAALVAGWKRLSDHQHDWAIESFRGVAPGVLTPTADTRIHPLILRGLGVTSAEEIVDDRGPLCALQDPGDRELIRDALLSGVPAILTTDLRSFWRHRSALHEYGLEVWRPSDALAAYEPEWAAEQDHFARRRVEQDAKA